MVLDVPAGKRVEAWERVRTMHAGMVLVAVDSQAETQDWPSDLARRFLVRPLGASEIVAALIAPLAPGPDDAAATLREIGARWRERDS